MKKIVLISCVSTKLPNRSKAKDLYISPLFVKSLEYARSLKPNAIYILSSKYGLLDLETVVDPYDVALRRMPSDQVRNWAQRVLLELAVCSDIQNDHFIFLAGVPYRKYLIPYMNSYEIPMKGLPIGKQLQFLSE